MDDENDKKEKKKIVPKATITPTPNDLALFQFLDHCFWEENCPDKIDLRVCKGPIASKFDHPGHGDRRGGTRS